MTVRIRPAMADDVAAIARLVTELGYRSQPEQIVHRLAALSPGRSVLLVAEQDSEITGLVQVFLKPSILVEHSAEIGALVVAASWQGRGIGKALLEAAEAWAIAHGCSTMYVRSNVVREAAHAFYERLGYRTLKTSHTFARPLSGLLEDQLHTTD